MKKILKNICRTILSLSIFILVGCSSPPSDIVEAAITENFKGKHTFNLDSWKETNSYTKEIDKEDVYFVEYDAKFRLKPELRPYLHSGGGISFPYEYYDAKGTVAVVKRGGKWYSE